MIKQWTSSELHLIARTKKDRRTLNKIHAKIDKILGIKNEYDEKTSMMKKRV